MDEKASSPIPHYIVGTLVVIVIILFSILAYRTLLTDEKQSAEPLKSRQGDDVVYNGVMSLATEGDQMVYEPGDEIHVLVYADSVSQTIGGYDVVLKVSSDDAEFVSAESLIEGFELFPNATVDKIIIPAVRDYNSPDEYTFNNEPIARIVLKPLHEGTLLLDFDFEQGVTSDTNLVPSTTDILKEATGIAVFIGGSIPINSGRTISIDNNTTVSYDSLNIPPQDCIDCVTEVAFTVKQGQKTENKMFTIGGFAGKITDSQKAFNYIFELAEVDESSLLVRYAPLE